MADDYTPKPAAKNECPAIAQACWTPEVVIHAHSTRKAAIQYEHEGNLNTCARECTPAGSPLLAVRLGVGQAGAQVAGELLADAELEAVAVLAVGALVQAEGGGPPLGGHHAGDATPLGLPPDAADVAQGVCKLCLCRVEGGRAGDALIADNSQRTSSTDVRLQGEACGGAIFRQKSGNDQVTRN